MRRYSSRYSRLNHLMLAAIAIGAVATVVPGKVFAEAPDKPRTIDSRVAVIVTQLIDQDHMSKHPLDDEISERAIQQFIDGLDDMKRYFTQEDIDEFMTFRRKVDDLLKAREVQLPYTIYNRFLKRIQERVELVNEFLDAELDFTKDESIEISPRRGEVCRVERGSPRHVASPCQIRTVVAEGRQDQAGRSTRNHQEAI